MQVETAENRDMCGWVQSILVFSQAHNLKVVGSNPTPATNNINDLAATGAAFFCSSEGLSDR